MQTSADTDEADSPHPPARVGRLDTITRVRREMVKVYKAMKQGKLQSSVGSKLVFVLMAIQKAIEFETTEERLDRLEQAVRGRTLPGREPPADTEERFATVRARLTLDG